MSTSFSSFSDRSSFLFRIYVKHHFPNLTLTTINFFVTFLLLLGCLQAKLFTYVRLPIISMIPVSICFGGFIAFSNLSLQYNTVGTYQLIKLQVTPGEYERASCCFLMTSWRSRIYATDLRLLIDVFRRRSDHKNNR